MLGCDPGSQIAYPVGPCTVKMKGRHAATTQVMQADGQTKSLSHAHGRGQHGTSDVSVESVHTLCIGIVYALMVTSDILMGSPL